MKTAIERLREQPQKLVACGLIVAAILGGAALRFSLLTHESLWLDEIFTVWLAKQPMHEMWNWVRLENHPPLYYLILHAWFACMGHSDYAARSFSACCSTLLIGIVGWTGWRYHPWIGALASLFAAVMPPLVRYGQEARMYALAALFSAVAVAGALHYAEQPRSRWSGWIYACAITLAYATHYYALFLWGSLAFGMTLVPRNRRTWSIRNWLLLNLLPALTLLAWLPILLEQWRVNGHTHWLLLQTPPDGWGPMTFFAWCVGDYDEKAGFGPGWGLLQDKQIGWAVAAIAVLIMGIVAFATYQKHATETRSIRTQFGQEATVWLLLFCTIIPIMVTWGVSQFKMIWQLKYLLVVVPVALGLLILGLVKLRQKPSLFIAISTLLWTSSLCASLSRVGKMTPFNQEEWREAANRLKQDWRRGDVVVVPEPTTLPPIWICLEHYGFSRECLIGVHEDMSRALDVEALRHAEHFAPRIWLVIRFGQGGQVGDTLSQSPLLTPTQCVDFRGITLQLFERPPLP